MYAQIEDYLKQRILEGDFPVHAAIPSERELTEMFGVSRMTVRQSVTNLVNEGLLYREKGRGTFIASPKVAHALSGLTSFTEDMILRGLKPSNRLVSFEKVHPPVAIAEDLALRDGEEVFVANRIRYADGEPMAVERTFVPVKLFPELNREILNDSLYSFVEEKKGLKISHATQFIEAALAKEEDAQLLQIEVPSSIVIIKQKSYLTDNTPFEVVESIYRADRYNFMSEIKR